MESLRNAPKEISNEANDPSSDAEPDVSSLDLATLSLTDVSQPVAVLMNLDLFANLLLKMPYRGTLTAVLTACQKYPQTLFGTWLSLTRQGLPCDITSTLPKVDHAANCPKLDPVSDQEGGARQLACGHSFHEPCLRHWFEVRKTCPACQSDVERMAPQPSFKTRTRGDRLSVTAMARELLVFTRQQHPAYVNLWLGPNPPRSSPAERFDAQSVFGNLLLQLPYEPTLRAVMTLYEDDPRTLLKIGDSLKEEGMLRDYVSTRTIVEEAVDCPTLDPLRGRPDEPCRRLICGHSFHDRCLRYWFSVRRTCPVCQIKLHCSPRLPDLMDEADYVERSLGGMTLYEMLVEMDYFFIQYHPKFCKVVLQNVTLSDHQDV